MEQMFRLRNLKAVIATATLAVGIHMPCKTAVFASDSPFLDVVQFQQMSGRAGRRGFDEVGNVVFAGVNFTKIEKLAKAEFIPIVPIQRLSATSVLEYLALLLDKPELALHALQSSLHDFMDSPQRSKRCLNYNMRLLHKFGLLRLTGGNNAQVSGLGLAALPLAQYHPLSLSLPRILLAVASDEANLVPKRDDLCKLLCHLFDPKTGATGLGGDPQSLKKFSPPRNLSSLLVHLNCEILWETGHFVDESTTADDTVSLLPRFHLDECAAILSLLVDREEPESDTEDATLVEKKTISVEEIHAFEAPYEESTSIFNQPMRVLSEVCDDLFGYGRDLVPILRNHRKESTAVYRFIKAPFSGNTREQTTAWLMKLSKAINSPGSEMAEHVRNFAKFLECVRATVAILELAFPSRAAGLSSLATKLDDLATHLYSRAQYVIEKRPNSKRNLRLRYCLIPTDSPDISPPSSVPAVAVPPAGSPSKQVVQKVNRRLPLPPQPAAKKAPVVQNKKAYVKPEPKAPRKIPKIVTKAKQSQPTPLASLAPAALKNNRWIVLAQNQ